MKYKQCPNCGRFIKHIKDTCICGEDISEIYDYFDLSQEEVDEKNLNPTAPIKNEEIKIEKSQKLICPICGTENPIDSLNCQTCGELFIKESNNETSLNKSINDKDVENERFQEINKDNKFSDDSTQIANVISFRVLYNGKTYKFIASSNEQSFGRNSLEDSSFINDRYISRKHFSYFCKNMKLYIIDTSTNGTSINGNKIESGREYLINNNDIISLYTRKIQIEYVR